MPAALKTDAGRRTLIAGVGYHNLRDNSFGPVLIERLKREEWPAGVELDDLSYGPVGVMHSLGERPRYDRVVLIGAVARGREPGGVYAYSWPGKLPDAGEIQSRMAEAVTGVISLENLLVIATYFGKLPEDVIVIEVEPADESWGEQLTPAVEKAIPLVMEEIRRRI